MSAIAVVRKQKGVDTSQIFLIGASEGTLLAAEAASRVPRHVKGLMLYGVLTSNMRENYKYLVTDGAYVAYLTYFDSDKDGKITKEEFEKDLPGFGNGVCLVSTSQYSTAITTASSLSTNVANVCQSHSSCRHGKLGSTKFMAQSISGSRDT